MSQGLDKLNYYEWGPVAIEKLQEIGAEDVKSVKIDGDYE